MTLMQQIAVRGRLGPLPKTLAKAFLERDFVDLHDGEELDFVKNFFGDTLTPKELIEFWPENLIILRHIYISSSDSDNTNM